MGIHLRQIALVAAKLEPVVADLTAVLGIRRCYVDDAVGRWGLQNTLMTIGTDFLEVVAPVRDGTAAGRYLERRQGDGGYMVITQADSAQTQLACRARAQAQSIRVAYERADASYHIMQLHPADMRASFLEIDSDSHGDFQGYWHPSGGTGWEPSIDTTRTIALLGARLQGPDPQALAARWAAVLGLPVVTLDGDPGIALANAHLRFVPEQDGRGPGLSGVDIQVADAEAILAAARQRQVAASDDRVSLCGTRFFLHPG